ncbi:MAG: HlyC/CorC family transporter [Lachnospiraceae bacterium]|nr:HlyC/CorC family transporter [Lachnospiraceae bacterium]
MESDSISLIIIVVCVIMSAYFSATETAFSSLNRIRIKNMAEKGNKRAQLVLRMSEKYDSMLSTILIGNNIVNIAGTSIATVLFVNLLGEEAGPSVSTAVTTVVVLIFGEVSPKSIAKESPEKFAMFFAPLLNILMKILTPFNFLFMQWKKLLSMLIKGDSDRGITEDELLTIVEEAEEDGGIGEQESELIRSAIEFSELEARDILTPRIDVTAIEVDASKEEIANLFAQTGYSRLPVYEDSIDHIVGIIYQKDFYKYVYHKEKDISSIIRPALFITEGKKIGQLLKELQKKKSHLAVILDEFGGTVGIVTMEDILEELVGEIWDEHDEVIEEIQKISDTEYYVLGSTNIEKVLELFDMEREMEVLTVSGWVMDEMERIPKKGDIFTYEHLQVEVLEMDGKRVDKVSIKKKKELDEEK